MKSYGWLVEFDTFVDQTPYGMKSFTNIISTLPIGTTYKYVDKNSPDTFKINHVNNRIVLACHYDSKYFTNFNFIGATDSAVPCALLLDLAKYLKELILPYELSIANLDRYLQFMFFDGEEAFLNWSATDSLYGSRHFATLLQSNFSMKAFTTMELFVLLDLIGASQSQFWNYFPYQTSSYYNTLARIGNFE